MQSDYNLVINKFIKEKKMKLMKNKYINIRTAAVKGLAGSFALLALLAFVLPMSAQANMAANTQIINAAHLSYNDGASTVTADSSVTVTVSLVPLAPTIPTGTGDSGQYTASNTVLNNHFTVVAQSNGPDSYTLTPAIVSQTNNNTSGTIGTMSPASPITLGGSVVVADGSHTNSATTIYVPTDGTADSVVNQIQANDWVVVGTSNPIQVQSVTDPGVVGGVPGIASIVFASGLSGGAPAAGDPVREQVTITVPVNSGTIDSSGSSIVITKHLTVASVTDPTKTVTSADVTDTYTSGAASFTKYVRNVTNAIVGGTDLQFPAGSGPHYYRTGVTAKTNEVLEYLIVVANSGTGDISAAVVTDGLPVTYANYNAGTIIYYDQSNTSHALTDAAADDAGKWVSPTITVNVGGTTPPTLPAAGGTIAAGETVHVVYRVTVK
jgi:hypothetical protein